MASNNNQVTELVDSQSDKVTTINQGLVQLDNLISEATDITVDADFVLTDTQQNNALAFNLIDGVIAGAFTMALQARNKLFILINGSVYDCTVEVDPDEDGADGATVVVAAGDAAILYSNGVDIIQPGVGASSGGGGSVIEDWKESVQLATTGNVTLSGEQTIDGVLTSTSRVLVKDNTTGSENGIYVTASGAWTRASDFDEDSEVTTGAATYVSEGTTNAGTLQLLTTVDPIVVGTTALVFGELSAGSGGGSGVDIEEDDVSTATGVDTINFEGAVDVTDDGSGKVTVNVTAGSIDVQEDDSSVNGATSTINFEGDVDVVDNGSGKVTVNVTGGSGGGGGPARGVRLSITSTFALGVATYTAIEWDAEDFDDADLADLGTQSTRITVPSGVTRMSFVGGVQFDSSANNTFLRIMKNGTDAVGAMRADQNGTGTLTVSSGIIDVVAGDYFELEAQHASGADVAVSSSTFFAAQIEEVGGGVAIEQDDVSFATDVDTINFEGDFTLTDEGNGKITVNVVGGSGGSGSGTEYFNGISVWGTPGTTTNATATKGNVFTPSQDITVEAVYASIPNSDSADTYVPRIVEMSDDTSSATVVSSIATGPSKSPQGNATLNDEVIRFPLTSPTVLTAGTTYLIGYSLTSGTGTSPADGTFINDEDGQGALNAPGETPGFRGYIAEIEPSNGTAYSSADEGFLVCWPEGTFELSSSGGSGGSTTITDYGAYAPFQPPTTTDFPTAATAGTVTSSTVTDGENRGLNMMTDANDNSVEMRLKSWTPATETHIFRVLIAADTVSHFPGGGFVIRDSSTGNFAMMGLFFNGADDSRPTGFGIDNFDSSGFDSNVSGIGNVGEDAGVGQIVDGWLRVDTTATGYTAYWSIDGGTWEQLGTTQTFASHVAAPDQIGFGVKGDTGSVALANFPFYSDDGSNVTTQTISGGSDSSGGGSRNSFGGIMIGDSTFTDFTGANATRGLPFSPTEDVEIQAVNGFIVPASTSETYVARIVEWSAADVSTASVVSIVATSQTVNAAVSGEPGIYRFTFDTNPTLTAGTIYLVAISRTDATGTDELRMFGDGNVAMTGPFVSYGAGTAYFNSTDLSVSDTPDAQTTSSEIVIWLEGIEDIDGGSGGSSGSSGSAVVPIIVAVGDETTALTTGTDKVTFRAATAFTIDSVKASLTTASTSGTVDVDINVNGTSIFSTVLTIDQDEETSVTAATAAVLSTTSVAADDEITIDIDAAGTGAAGLKVTIIPEASESSSGGSSATTPFTNSYNIENATGYTDAGDGLSVEDWTSIPAAWTVHNMTEETVDFRDATGDMTDDRYDITTRPGTCLMQLQGPSGTSPGFRTANILADGESIVSKWILPIINSNASSSTGLEVKMGMNDNTTSFAPDSNNNAGIEVKIEDSQEIEVFAAGDGTGAISNTMKLPNSGVVYLRITRSTDGNYYFMVSTDGQTWCVMQTQSVSGFAPTPITTWVVANAAVAAGAAQPIFGLDWIRHVASEALDLWPSA